MTIGRRRSKAVASSDRSLCGAGGSNRANHCNYARPDIRWFPALLFADNDRVSPATVNNYVLISGPINLHGRHAVHQGR